MEPTEVHEMTRNDQREAWRLRAVLAGVLLGVSAGALCTVAGWPVLTVGGGIVLVVVAALMVRDRVLGAAITDPD